MDRVVGTCSECFGPVTLPEAWMGVNPPVPTCKSCHATAKPQGPVIPMESSPKKDSLRKRLLGRAMSQGLDR